MSSGLVVSKRCAVVLKPFVSRDTSVPRPNFLFVSCLFFPSRRTTVSAGSLTFSLYLLIYFFLVRFIPCTPSLQSSSASEDGALELSDKPINMFTPGAVHFWIIIFLFHFHIKTTLTMYRLAFRTRTWSSDLVSSALLVRNLETISISAAWCSSFVQSRISNPRTDNHRHRQAGSWKVFSTINRQWTGSSSALTVNRFSSNYEWGNCTAHTATKHFSYVVASFLFVSFSILDQSPIDLFGSFL